MPDTEVHEDWKSALEAYARNPDGALCLAQLLKQIKEHVEAGHKRRRRPLPQDTRKALAQLEIGIRTLHQYTTFNKVSRKFYRLAIAGKLSGKQYKRLREMGVKF